MVQTYTFALMENLNKENFWNEMKEKYPSPMEDFCQWIDEYKISVEWKKLFNENFSQSNKKYASNGELASIDFSEPKFHDLPLAMQMGIWREYLDAHDTERSKREVENYLSAAQEGIQEVESRLKDKGIL